MIHVAPVALRFDKLSVTYPPVTLSLSKRGDGGGDGWMLRGCSDFGGSGSALRFDRLSVTGCVVVVRFDKLSVTYPPVTLSLSKRSVERFNRLSVRVIFGLPSRKIYKSSSHSMKTLYVYIVECIDKSYYTGVTNHVERRVDEHNAGLDTGCYTFNRRPVTLRFVQACPGKLQAIAFEKQVKGWSRQKKLALIEGRWNDLSALSRNRQIPLEGDAAEPTSASTSSA